MPKQNELHEVQNLQSHQSQEWFGNMRSIRQEVDISKLYMLMQDSECPAWIWFPNNAEMLKLAEYLVSKGVTFKEECLRD